MEEILPNSNADAIREVVIILIGLLIRAFEKRRMKKALNNAESEN